MGDRESAFHYSPDWSPQEVFLSAAVNGDVDTLRRMVDAGTGVDTVDKEGVSALLRAANAGKPAAVRYLLQAGADIRLRDRSGRSLLHLVAAWPANLGLIDEVLARGLAVDDQFDGGDTPLMSALLRGHLAGARALLARGADPRVRDRHGNTSVVQMISGIYAFRGGAGDRDALALLDELLRAGVDPRAKGQYGRDAMSIAAGKGLQEVVAVLQRHGSPIDSVGSDGLTPLQQAWLGRHTEETSWLVRQGAPVDFHSAVAQGRCSEVEKMLDQTPQLIDRELRGARAAPLAIALRQGQADMVRLLLQRGADPNGRDPENGSLRNAVRNLPDVAILRLLIDHGADLDAADGDGNTALNLAARDDRLELARLLLEAGADPNSRTERGYPVLGFARSDAMRTLLRKHGGVER